MVTSSDWHKITTFKDQNKKNPRENFKCRSQNTRILQQFVETLVSQYKGKVEGKKVPYLIFEELKACHDLFNNIDLTAYPSSLRTYQKYIVYNHVESFLPPFCFTLLVFTPKQKTPKHSHRVDCAPLCLKGLVKETLYQETEDSSANDPHLKVIRTKIYRPYEGAYLHKDLANIHHLENVGIEVSMSLHLYLFDANGPASKCTSILKVYP